MLTIKNLTWTGAETLHMAEEVSFHPGDPADPNTASGSIMFLDRGEWHQIHDGNVYVMNDKGATIANYRLGGPKAALSGVVTANRRGAPIGMTAAEAARAA